MANQEIFEGLKKIKDMIDSKNLPDAILNNDNLMKSLDKLKNRAGDSEKSFLLTLKNYSDSLDGFKKDLGNEIYSEDTRIILNGQHTVKNMEGVITQYTILVDIMSDAIIDFIRDIETKAQFELPPSEEEELSEKLKQAEESAELKLDDQSPFDFMEAAKD